MIWLSAPRFEMRETMMQRGVALFASVYFIACQGAAPSEPTTSPAPAAVDHGHAPGLHDLHDPGSSPDTNERPGLTVKCDPPAETMPEEYTPPPENDGEIIPISDVQKFTLTTLVTGAALAGVSDLAFHPTRDELWIISYDNDGVITVENPGKPTQKAYKRTDPAHMHFMHYPTGLSFGPNDTWATCGDNTNGGNYFMGPTLFSSDPDIFAYEWTELGSHLDMLHVSPYCMGIEHVSANKYWVFNGYYQSLDLYDFVKDHGPGNDDHSDGRIYRYATGEVKRIKGVPSHLSLDGSVLYVADTGHGRILKIDPSGAKKGADLTQTAMEPLVEFREMDGASVTEFVPPGTLKRPSGIEVVGSEVWVTDNATSNIVVYDKQGKEKRTYRTKLSAGSLAGLTRGPDGKMYLVDMNRSRVYRLDE